MGAQEYSADRARRGVVGAHGRPRLFAAREAPMKERRSPRQRGRALVTALPPQAHVTSAASTEVALHELGESLVTSAVTLQRELRRYGEANGALLLEDLEMELPVKLRVDSLGQMMAEVVNEPPANSVLTRIRLRIRPD